MRKSLTFNNSLEMSAKNSDSSENEINLFELGTFLLQRKKFIVYTVGIVMLLTTVILLLIPNKYRSTATILPSGTKDKLASLKSLAGFGNFSANESSSELFPVIIRSQLTGKTVLNETYTFQHKDKLKTLTLPDYFDENDPDKLKEKLAKIISTSMDKKTGVIRLSVETKYSGFSQAVLRKYLSELEDFNLNKRRSRAGENERYLAQRMKLKEEELEQAEKNLEQFQSANRNWIGSSNPQIIKELAGLKRNLEITTKAFLFLAQEYELAKFEAQKDVPIVQLLDSPSLPTQKSSPHRLLILILTLVITFLGAVFSVVIYESFKRKSTGANKEEYQVFRESLSKTFPRMNRLISSRKDNITV